MQENTKNVFVGLLVVIFVAFLVGLFVWGMTRFSLGKQINHLSQEKTKFETLVQDKEKEKETAIQKTVDQYKAILSKFEEKPKMGCETASSIDDIKKRVGEDVLDRILLDSRVSGYKDAISSVTWCRLPASSISLDLFHAFVLSGDFGKENNIIGYITKEGSIMLDKQYSQPMGDIGVCGVSGFIDGNLMYQCAGGDGPGGFSSWYVLKKDAQKSVLIKSCTYMAGEEVNQTTCDKNLLNLAQ